MAAPTVLDKARATVVLDHPFFASVLLRHPMEATKSIKTCCINGRTGRILYNPDFVQTLTVKQAVFLLCHELLHYVGMDSARVGNRDKKKWNHVADEWINDTLNKLGIGEMIPGGVHRPGASESTREQLYDMLPEDEDGSGKDQPQGEGEGDQPGNGEGDQPGNGAGDDPLGGDVEYEDKMTEAEQHEHEANVKLELAEAAQAAKMRGKLPGLLQKMVAGIIETKVPWYDVLERHMTERIKCDVSWAKPNRRYAPDFYLPVIDGVGAMGEIVVQVDISGSVSREEIAHYNGHLKRIIEQCHPTKVHVLYTDTEVQKHEEFDNPEEVQITYHSGGDTRMEAGFDYLAEKGIEPTVVITLTDGYDSYTNAPPGYPVLWCVSTDRVPPYGETIPFSMA